MPIPIQCAGCGARNLVPDDWAGKRAKCRRCATLVDVPTVKGHAAEGLPNAVPTPATSESHSVSVTGAVNLTHKADHEKQRRDPAALQWCRHPEEFRPDALPSVEPICPYCGTLFRNRKPPSRRSTFACSNCQRDVSADPWQRVFSSVYLTARQGLIARYLARLDEGVATAGRMEDFLWCKRQLKWTRDRLVLTDSQAADVLWALMNYNVVHMREICPPERRECLREYAHQLQRWMHA